MGINYATITRANVYLRNKLAGKLEKVNSKKYVFEYDSEYIRTKGVSIGMSLEISKVRFETENLNPFFDNLIPEGWLLRHAEKIYKIDKDNKFAILMATGKHPVGAVKVIPLDDEAQEIEAEFDEEIDENEKLQNLVNLVIPGICPYCLKTLNSVVDKEKKFHQRCAKNLWGTARPLQISLNSLDPLDSFRKTIYGASISGAQRKGLFNLNKTVLRPATNEAHFILKPPGDYEQLPENEHVTMVIAKELGFNVPDIGIFETTAGRVFVIKRFDFIKGQQARLEDIAQILRIPSEDKYESSNEKVGQAIKKFSDIPKLDVVDYWRRLLFCYITGNGDMHLKNWSLFAVLMKLAKNNTSNYLENA